jgi:glucuronoarabinoxylan endo-1,4-beta-xylanase
MKLLIFLLLCLVAAAPVVEVDPAKRAQTIHGWGGSSAWFTDEYMAYTDDARAAFVDYLWGEDGLGLNVHRIRVIATEPHPETNEPVDWTSPKLIEQARFLKYVQDRHDPIVLASSWTPPDRMKTNNDGKGGKLRADQYGDFAEYLAEYVAGMKEHFGVDIDIVSPQNEPDGEKPWDSCVWTGEELATFVGEHLGPTLQRRGLDTRILVGEHTRWDDSMIDVILADEQAAPFVDLVGGHLYHDTHDQPRIFETAVKLNRPVWQTEFYLGDYRFPKDQPIDEHVRTLRLAEIMHDALVHSEVNAYLFWWLLSEQPKSVQALLVADYTFGDRDESVPMRGWSITPRAHGFGQFSRFVRPGAVRLDLADDEPIDHVFVCAFAHDADAALAIVATNRTGKPQQIQLKLPIADGLIAVTRTSRDEQMAAVEAVTVVGGVVDVTLVAQSITTFYAESP